MAKLSSERILRAHTIWPNTCDWRITSLPFSNSIRPQSKFFYVFDWCWLIHGVGEHSIRVDGLGRLSFRCAECSTKLDVNVSRDTLTAAIWCQSGFMENWGMFKALTDAAMTPDFETRWISGAKPLGKWKGGEFNPNLTFFSSLIIYLSQKKRKKSLCYNWNFGLY